jgi:hypothetical protein
MTWFQSKMMENPTLENSRVIMLLFCNEGFLVQSRLLQSTLRVHITPKRQTDLLFPRQKSRGSLPTAP